MSKVVIIGAGPMGLYLAFKLKKAGVKDIVIYGGKHAGNYTRPGHINNDVFESLEEYLGESFWQKDQGHIKDVERILYERVIQLGVTVEKKEFIRFNNNPKQKGVIVLNERGEEVLVECYFAFDCTGSKRVLVHKINETVQPPPFTIKQITTEINVKNHFLAYVAMSKSDLVVINTTQDKQNYSASQFVQCMEQLRELGWQEFNFPRCYGVNFHENKACLYLECPDNLPQELQEKWVRAVIAMQTNSNSIQFDQLPVKQIAKPRFMSFQVVPMEVEQPAYEGAGLPIVIPVGDASIDPNYFLAHGIRDGLLRVNKMVKEMDIVNGTVVYFDAAAYVAHTKKLIDEHRNDILTHYKERSRYFLNGLTAAEYQYNLAIKQSIDQDDSITLHTTLIEIRARVNLMSACHMLQKCTNTKGQVIFPEHKLSDLKSKLSDINQLLIASLEYLPQTLGALRGQALLKLKQVVSIWKDLGGHYFKLQKYEKAISAYKQAIDILTNPILRGELRSDVFVMYSNLVICYRKAGNPLEAISLAQEFLAMNPEDCSLEVSKKKILFNLIKAYETLTVSVLKDGELEYAAALSQKICDILSEHAGLFDDELQSKTKNEMTFFNMQLKSMENNSRILDQGSSKKC